MRLVLDSYKGFNINDGTNYVADFPEGTPLTSPTTPISVDMYEIPSMNVGRRHVAPTVSIFVQPQGNYREQREELKSVFTTEERFTFYPLVAHDEDDSDRVWTIQAAVLTATPMDDAFIIVLAPKTYYWRSNNVGDTFEFTASEESHTFNMPITTHPVRPTIRMTPTAPKAGSSYLYQRWIAFRNFSNATGTTGFDIGVSLDTAALITAGKIRSDGFDLRVLLNNVEVPRWFGNWNTADTKIWIILQSPNTYGVRYVEDIAATGAVTVLTIKDTATDRERFANWPATGEFVVGDERFLYTAKNATTRQLTGITRAHRGTAMAAHPASANGLNLQSVEVKIVYGNPDAEDPEYSDETKPMFDLDLSTNTSHVYEFFGDSTGLRTPQWVFSKRLGESADTREYTASHDWLADPYEVMGYRATSQDVAGVWMADTVALRWMFNPPFKLSNIEASGEVWRNVDQIPTGTIYTYDQGRVTAQFLIPPAVALETWEPWSCDIAIAINVDLININFAGSIAAIEGAVAMQEVQTLTLEYVPGNVPIPSMGSEVGTYDYNLLIENLTTGHKIAVVRKVNIAAPYDGTLEIDTENHTVLVNGWNPNPASVTPYNTKEWFRMDPGNNIIKVTDLGLAGMDVEIEGPGTRGV